MQQQPSLMSNLRIRKRLKTVLGTGLLDFASSNLMFCLSLEYQVILA
jgi:hypothetical protein